MVYGIPPSFTSRRGVSSPLLIAMASNLVAMACNLIAMASNLLAMGSNLLAKASNRIAMCLQPTSYVPPAQRRCASNILQPTSEGFQPK